MGKTLLKLAVNLISLPATSTAVTGRVFVTIAGPADNFRTEEFKDTPKTAARR